MSNAPKHWHLYVLKLEQGKYYVGITSKTPEHRFKQHKKKILGANWTRKYSPIKIHYTKDLGICTEQQAQTYEGRVTRKYMEEYGDNNVRGGDLTDTETYTRRFGRLFLKDDWEVVSAISLLMLVIATLLLERVLQ